jgi:hypothetical protein
MIIRRLALQKGIGHPASMPIDPPHVVMMLASGFELYALTAWRKPIHAADPSLI